jgi:hypothetical protein
VPWSSWRPFDTGVGMQEMVWKNNQTVRPCASTRLSQKLCPQTHLLIYMGEIRPQATRQATRTGGQHAQAGKTHMQLVCTNRQRNRRLTRMGGQLCRRLTLTAWVADTHGRATSRGRKHMQVRSTGLRRKAWRGWRQWCGLLGKKGTELSYSSEKKTKTFK